MKALIFVDNQREVNNINIMMKPVALDFELTVLCSYESLIEHLEANPVDVFICRLGLSSCIALELFQLARMYNSEVLNIATGDNNCVKELIDTFNKENLFKFIPMPWLHHVDFVDPVHQAMNYMHNKIQAEYDRKTLEEDVSILGSDMEKLTAYDKTYEKMFKETDILYNRFFRQNYQFLGKKVNEDEAKFALFAFETYNDYFYNNLTELNNVLRDIIMKYRVPTEGKFFSVKHNLKEEPGDLLRAKILFNLTLLNEFFYLAVNEYKIGVVIGLVDDKYLIKYDYSFTGMTVKAFGDALNSFNFKRLKAYVAENSAKGDFIPTEKGMEIRIVVA
ncbi:MAG: hypothetical protein E7241_01015 [Lachnospiraceae bacterium]|jgi:hypothetical protein|nr:hypothetical protein [Lachnospiraceae bacterium]